jgi:hypothetical protein
MRSGKDGCTCFDETVRLCPLHKEEEWFMEEPLENVLLKMGVGRLAFNALMKREKFIKSKVISEFAEDAIPSFRQGWPTHELEDFATAEQCTYLVKRISDLEEEAKIMKAGIKDIHGMLKRGDKTEDHGWKGNLSCIVDALISKAMYLDKLERCFGEFCVQTWEAGGAGFISLGEATERLSKYCEGKFRKWSNESGNKTVLSD